MLAKRVADPSYHPDAIIRSLNALALLASGKPEHRSIVSKEAQWAAGFSADSMAAVLFNLLDEPAGAEFFARMSLFSHGGERDCGHTGNYFSILWAMPGVALSGPHATGAWMQEFGEWYYDLSRQWDGGFDHLGPPEPGYDSYEGWDATGACLLAYAVPLKSLWLTGKRPGKVTQLAAAAAEQFIRTSRGWTQGDLYSLYDIGGS